MGSTGKVRAGTPSQLRTFDPVRLGDLEYRAWVGYYLRRWPQVLIALVGLVRAGFGMDWRRTLHGAWLVLRAARLWAPYPDNDPKRAKACMRRFYTLVKLTYGERLAEAIPDARLVRIDDSRTFVSEDQPERLGELIGGFVRETSGAAAPASAGL